MFDLAGHHRPGHTFLVEGFDQPRKLTQGEPVHPYPWILLGPRIHFRFRFFFDGRDHDLHALSARCVQQQKWKSSIAGNQTQPGDLFWFHSAAPT